MSARSDESVDPQSTFADLGLSEAVLSALADVGYESPSPIQAAMIPHLMASKDVLGQAQTGTGKTAAFALPLLSKIDLSQRTPQVLVLAPTRELAIQVAEAFQKYASHLKGFHVVPIYGGQSYTPQLQSLRRGVHVVVGTPGRVMDHMKRGTLDLKALSYLVLDEADEMLNMGFLEDVEWILEQTPPTRNIALFSATMPAAVRRIAQTHLKSPAEVTIRGKTSTAANIRQRYWVVSGMHKLDALTRILEAETFDGMLIFTRTKQSTVELAEKLGARGYAAEALNGDIAQAQRERTVARLKSGQIDIVVATDVAARGLDVERIGHVVNFDIPYDSESYIHRIGRTGRAGRSGEAILFIAPRERNMLRVIERATRQPIEPMELPTIQDVNQQRVARFMGRITTTLADDKMSVFRSLIEEYERENNVPAVEIAAALAILAQGKTPLLLEDRRKSFDNRPSSEGRSDRDRVAPENFSHERSARPPRDRDSRPARDTHESRETREPRAARPDREAPAPRTPREKSVKPETPREERPHAVAAEERSFTPPADRKKARRPDGDAEMETYRIEVGHVHGVKPGNIVGAIANEANIEGQHIGRVDIREDHSFVDLPPGMPKETFRDLQKVRVQGQMLQISRALRTVVDRDRKERGERPSNRASLSDPRVRAERPKFPARRPTLHKNKPAARR
jgi:ATP-dependent RNA helicase DeaD